MYHRKTKLFYSKLILGTYLYPSRIQPFTLASYCLMPPAAFTCSVHRRVMEFLFPKPTRGETQPDKKLKSKLAFSLYHLSVVIKQCLKANPRESSEGIKIWTRYQCSQHVTRTCVDTLWLLSPHIHTNTPRHTHTLSFQPINSSGRPYRDINLADVRRCEKEIKTILRRIRRRSRRRKKNKEEKEKKE